MTDGTVNAGGVTWRITSLGHAGFRIETGGQTLLVDPWLRGNPAFPEARFDEAVAGATHILVTHGHGDHAPDVREIAATTGATVIAIIELAELLGVENSVAINKGGSVSLGEPDSGEVVGVTMVHAVHSSSMKIDGRSVYAGEPAGFMIRSAGESLYVMGDTDVFADMALLAELHRPAIGLAPIGGHFTMGAQRAAFACNKFFNFRVVIPCHYGTFPVLAQDAEAFVQAVAPTRVEVLGALQTLEL